MTGIRQRGDLPKPGPQTDPSTGSGQGLGTRFGQIISLVDDQIQLRFPTLTGLPAFIAFDDDAIVGNHIWLNYPTGEIQRDRATGGYPFAIVTAGKMQVAGVGLSSFTGGVTNNIAGLYPLSGLQGGVQVQRRMEIKQGPTCLELAITVKIDLNFPLPGDDCDSGGGGPDRLGGIKAVPENIRGAKVNRSPGAAIDISRMRPGGKIKALPFAPG